MNTSVRARRGARGFSMVELLVTIVIAGIAFAAMVPLFAQALQSSSRDKARSIALNVAQDRMEKLRQLDFELITDENLAKNDFYFGEFGSSWTEETESGERTYKVAYSVLDKPVSTTDQRIAYKFVTVTVVWDGNPRPMKPAVLSTMIYRQYAGPELSLFEIFATDLGPSELGNPLSEPMIVKSPVNMRALVNPEDLDLMMPKFVGVAPNQKTLKGRVDFMVTSSSGTAFPTISAPYVGGAEFIPLPWPVPGDEPGAGDGYYTFKAMAFTALGSQGNSWELTYRVETGPPAPVGNLVGTAGKTSASLTWTASPTADLDHYEVTRADPDGTIVTVAGDPDTPPKFLGLGFSELEGALTENSTYTYSVYAVDWMGNRSVAAQLTLTATELLTQPPLPATNLRGEVIGSSARLTWGASLTPTVVGYKVYVNGGATSAYTTSLATLDIDQGWGTTAWYQVKPYIDGDVVSTQWASLFPGSPSEPLSGVEWVKVVVGAEPRYTLNIGNTTNKALATLKLYYLGPLGAPQPAVPVPPDKTNVAKDAISTWTDLAAGQYRWDWVTSNNKAGSKTAPVSGSVLIINEGTP